jgi:hypothetical protein
MLPDGAPQGRRAASHVVDPVLAGRGRRHQRGHGVDDELVESAAAVEVVVERHRSGAERGGQRAHRQRGQPVAVDDRQRLLLDLAQREPCGPGHPASS